MDIASSEKMGDHALQHKEGLSREQGEIQNLNLELENQGNELWKGKK